MSSTPFKYELKRFTPKSLNDTHLTWRGQMAGNALLLAQYQRIFDWSLANIDYSNDKAETFAFGIFAAGGTAHADAMVEVVYTRNGTKWVKMLDLHLSPYLDDAFYAQTANTETAVHISAAAITGVVALSGSGYPSETVKLYARHEPLQAFFSGIANAVRKEPLASAIDVRMDGRWLVFEK